MDVKIFLHTLGLFLAIFYGFLLLICTIGSSTNKLTIDKKIFVSSNLIFLLFSCGVALIRATS